MSLADKLTNLSPLQKMMDRIPLPSGEPFPGETLIADGWTYKDLPRLNKDYFDKFKLIVGDENIRWLSLSKYGNGEMRGQLLISPTEMNRLQGYLEAQKEE